MGKDNCYPYIAVIIVQLIGTGLSLLSKASISGGMKPSIFVTYQQAVGFLFLAPFAYFLDGKTSTPLTLKLLFKIFFIATFGVALNLNLCFSALIYASATFATAINNTTPAIVFIMAVLLRQESLAITQWHGKAKVVGCVVCLSGAMVLTFFKGPLLYHAIGKKTNDHSTSTHAKEDQIKGFFLMFSSTFLTSLWLIAQASIRNQYSAVLRLTTLQCCFSSIMSALWAAATQRHISSWKLGWNVNLLSVLYCGILVGGIMYWFQNWVVDKKGPVFASMFTPLSLVSTAVLSALIFKEVLHLGSVLGGIILVAGLYGFLWGKRREEPAEAQTHEKQPANTALDCVTISRVQHSISV